MDYAAVVFLEILYMIAFLVLIGVVVGLFVLSLFVPVKAEEGKPAEASETKEEVDEHA